LSSRSRSSVKATLYLIAMLLGIILGLRCSAEDACWPTELSPSFKALPAPVAAAAVDPGVADEFLYVDTDARPYVDDFEDLGRMHLGTRFRITRLSVRFVDRYSGKVDPDMIGECTTEHGMVPSVTLLRSWFLEADAFGREELIFHELGHCVLFKGHNRRRLPSGMPESIMYPSIVGPRYYNRKNRAYYIWELFSNSHLDRGYVGKDIGPDKAGYKGRRRIR
jgi:hypothetical protein